MAEPNQTLMERLDAGTVLVAEGYIFELERRGVLKAGPFVPEAVLKYPDVVQGPAPGICAGGNRRGRGMHLLRPPLEAAVHR